MILWHESMNFRTLAHGVLSRLPNGRFGGCAGPIESIHPLQRVDLACNCLNCGLPKVNYVGYRLRVAAQEGCAP